MSRSDLRVRYGETDQMGVVYHAHYLVWCEVGRTDLMRQAGLPYADIEERGFALAVSDASLRYHAPARYDQRIFIDTFVHEVKSRTVEFRYVVSNADTGEKLVTASTTLVCLDPRGKVVAMPDDVKRTLEDHVVVP